MQRNRGSMLLEILLVMGVLIMTMPLIMRKGFLARKDQQNQAVAHKMKTLGAVVLNYIQSYPDELEEGLTIFTDQNLINTFVPYGLSTQFNGTDVFNHTYEVHIDRKNEEAGGFELDAVIVVYNPSGNSIDFLRRKKIAEYLGLGGAIVDEDGSLFSLAGMWNMEENPWEQPLPAEAIVMRVQPVEFFNTYLSRTRIDDLGNANTMTTDLYMSNFNIERVKTFYAIDGNILTATGNKLTVIEGFGSATDESVEKKLYSAEFNDMYVYSDAGSETDVLIVDTPLNVSGDIIAYEIEDIEGAEISGSIDVVDLAYVNVKTLTLTPNDCTGQGETCSENSELFVYEIKLGAIDETSTENLNTFELTDAKVTVDDSFYSASGSADKLSMDNFNGRSIFFNYDTATSSPTYQKYKYSLNLSGGNTVVYDMEHQGTSLTTQLLKLYNRVLIKRTTGE